MKHAHRRRRREEALEKTQCLRFPPAAHAADVAGQAETDRFVVPVEPQATLAVLRSLLRALRWLSMKVSRHVIDSPERERFNALGSNQRSRAVPAFSAWFDLSDLSNVSSAQMLYLSTR